MSPAEHLPDRRTRSGTLRPLFRSAAMLLCAALAACAARGGAGRPALLSSPIGPALEAMWEAAGGIEEWRRYEAVGFTYEASLGPAAARLGAPPAGEAGGPVRLGPERITFGIRDWSTIGIGRGDDSWDLALDSPPDRDVRDLALRGVRFLFCFPFVLGEPVWEFRRDIIAGLPVDPRGGFWAIPSAPGSPYRSCYVDLPPGRGFPRAVYYRVSHPVLADRVFKAVFLRYRKIGGFTFPTEIAHYVSGGESRGEARYPWEGPGDRERSAAEEGLVLRERFSEVEFRRRPEAVPGAGSEGPEAPRLPLEEQASPAAASARESGDGRQVSAGTARGEEGSP